MFGLGAGEILIILAFALIFIGPKKLPELARGLGKSIREFQKAKDELMASVHEESEELKKGITDTADANSAVTHKPDGDTHPDDPSEPRVVTAEDQADDEKHHDALTQNETANEIADEVGPKLEKEKSENKPS